MAKKSKMPIAAGVMSEYTPPPVPDNHTKGVLRQPDYSTDPAAGNYGKGKFDFAGLVGKGESPNSGDVNVITANGVSSSKGKNKDAQYNYGNGTDGSWNQNREFDGDNLTGM